MQMDSRLLYGESISIPELCVISNGLHTDFDCPSLVIFVFFFRFHKSLLD